MAWYHLRERGSVLGLRIIYYVGRVFGYRLTHAALHIVIAYFYLSGSAARAAVAQFHRRLLGRSSPRLTYATFFHFAESVLDRLFFLMGKENTFICTVHGADILETLSAQGKGALLLGSHTGPMEAARLFAQKMGFKIHVLIYSDISPKLYRLLDRVNPSLRASMIPVKPNSVDYIFDVKKILDQNRFVAVLADRAWESGPTRTASFLGAPAMLPLGPFHIALTLGVPTVFIFAMKTGLKRYDVFIERISESHIVPRRDRTAAAADLQERYLRLLERYVRLAPTQWYNFFPFWEGEAGASRSGKETRIS